MPRSLRHTANALCCDPKLLTSDITILTRSLDTNIMKAKMFLDTNVPFHMKKSIRSFSLSNGCQKSNVKHRDRDLDSVDTDPATELHNLEQESSSNTSESSLQWDCIASDDETWYDSLNVPDGLDFPTPVPMTNRMSKTYKKRDPNKLFNKFFRLTKKCSICPGSRRSVSPLSKALLGLKYIPKRVTFVQPVLSGKLAEQRKSLADVSRGVVNLDYNHRLRVDPVQRFHQYETVWKADKFLTRGDTKNS